MGVKDSNFQVVYRGEVLQNFISGGWVFFQRPKECGGGYWLGRTYDDCFIFGCEHPVSLNYGLSFLLCMDEIEKRANDFDSDFQLS